MDYIFWNLLCATEQFKFFVYLLKAKDPEQNIPLVYDPPTFGDRLNMYQTAVVWLSFFTLSVIPDHRLQLLNPN